MKKREVTELRRRLTKKSASFSRMAGCYVDMNHNKVCRFSRPFLSLEDDEFFKYLEIASKTLSGSVGNNLLNLEFPREAEQAGGSQALLMGLRATGLCDEALLEDWYDRVIEHYDRLGNYLILLYADAYDMPVKATDETCIGESEEVFSYLICAVCPVELSDPGLGYREEENSFGARTRDWVVEPPETGFLFPSFNSRSADIHETLFYTKNAKEPHREMMEQVLGCSPVQTAAEQRLDFGATVLELLDEEDGPEDRLLDLTQNLNDLNQAYLESLKPEEQKDESFALHLDEALLEQAIGDTRIPGEKAVKLKNQLLDNLAGTQPPVENFIDKRALKTNALRLERNTLQDELLRTVQEMNELKRSAPEPGGEVVLSLSEEKAEYVRYALVGGERFLLVPVDEDETVLVNGEEL